MDKPERVSWRTGRFLPGSSMVTRRPAQLIFRLGLQHTVPSGMQKWKSRPHQHEWRSRCVCSDNPHFTVPRHNANLLQWQNTHTHTHTESVLLHKTARGALSRNFLVFAHALVLDIAEIWTFLLMNNSRGRWRRKSEAGSMRSAHTAGSRGCFHLCAAANYWMGISMSWMKVIVWLAAQQIELHSVMCTASIEIHFGW